MSTPVLIGLMTALTNLLAAALTATAIAIYVFGYTVGLKRRTSQNVVWGGVAGCLPVLSAGRPLPTG